MRFNKGYPEELSYPLTAIPEAVEGSQLVSPHIAVDHGLEAPTHPEDAEFDAELQEVVQVVSDVRYGKWPAEFLEKHHYDAVRHFDPKVVPEPLAMMGISADDPMSAALAVQMDNPIDLALAIMDWLFDKGEIDWRQHTGHIDFHQQKIGCNGIIAQRQRMSAVKGWEEKYRHGRARPEEALRMPGGLFTAYKAGCPCHPSYPAQHAVQAGTVADTIIHIFKIERESTLRVIYNSAYHFSMYRTFAGVHYASDNLAGLWLGGMDPAE